MTKYSFPLLLSFFLALFLNADSKAQIVYPDKATFDINNLSTLINFESYNTTFPEYDFGPDASVLIENIDDSISIKFGHSSLSMIAKAKQWSDFSSPQNVNFKVYDDNKGHYLGSRDPDPSKYDYELWPHKTVFEGKDGHLYSISYLEFTGWTVWGWNTP